jgi:hypothetical protein
VTAHINHIQPSMPPQPSSTDPVSTASMPVGRSITNTSAGHSHFSAATISFRSRRGRPGCVRYQCPSSIASESAPMNAAPTSVRASATAGLPPASSAAAIRPMEPITTGTRSRTGGNSGPTAPCGRPATGASTARSNARHRRDPLAPAVVLRSRPADTCGLALHRHHQRNGTGDHHTDRRDLAHRDRPERQPRRQGTGRETEVHAAQQPAVAQAGDASTSGEPAEQHPAGRPLQQHGGGVEADHVRQR